MKITADVRFSTVPEWLIYADVSPQAIRLYAVLDRHADKSHRAVPGQARLARLMRASVATVKRATAELERVGAVSVIRGETEDRQKATNEYVLHVSPPEVTGELTPELADEPPPKVTGEPRTKALERKTPERERDPAFDALAEETGNDLKALTRSAARTIGVALAEIIAAELTTDRQWTRAELADDIRYRAERYRRLHPDWQLTAPSLAKYWPTLGTRPLPNGRAPTVTELRAAIPDDQYDPGEPISEQYARLKRERAGGKT